MKRCMLNVAFATLLSTMLTAPVMSLANKDNSGLMQPEPNSVADRAKLTLEDMLANKEGEMAKEKAKENAKSAADSANNAETGAQKSEKFAEIAGKESKEAKESKESKEASPDKEAGDKGEKKDVKNAQDVVIHIEKSEATAEGLDPDLVGKKAVLRFLADGKEICKETKKINDTKVKVKLKKCDFADYKGKSVDAELSVEGKMVAKGKIDIDEKGKANGDLKMVGPGEDTSKEAGKKGGEESAKPTKKKRSLPETSADYGQRALFSAGVACIGLGAALGLYLVRRRRSLVV